jgi:hypothetical protein
MTQIDWLRRITLRDLQPFFENLRKVRGRALEAMQMRPERAGEVLSSLRNYLQGEVTYTRSWLGGEPQRHRYSIQAEVNENAEIESFLFRWDYRGEAKEQRVWLTYKQSNLVGGAWVCYFLCPYTGRRCRKLYTDGRELVSRYAFKHTYSERNLSHNDREFRKGLALALYLESSGAKNRREWYAGKLTRFGRRIKRMEEAEQRAGLQALLSKRKRGRPAARPQKPPKTHFKAF